MWGRNGDELGNGDKLGEKNQGEVGEINGDEMGERNEN